jgi:hypothetical protein
MGFFENVRNFLKKLVKRYSALIVSFLSNFIQSLKVSDFQNGLVNQISKELFRLLDELDVTVDKVNLFKEFFFLYPVFLNYRKITMTLFLSEP